MKARLASHVGSGVLLTSHYSGMGTAEDAAVFALSSAMNALGITLPAGSQPVFCYSACDIDPLCRKVLLQGLNMYSRI